MMKPLLLGGGLALLATVALAQTAPQPPDGPGGPNEEEQAPNPPPPPPAHDARWPEAPPPPHGHHHGPPPQKGADFKIDRLGNHIDIKCPDEEPVGACVDAAVKLLGALNPPPPRAER